MLSGFERHSVALAALGAITLLMAVGTGLGRSRPAAVSLVVIGALVLSIAILSDVPVTRETGAIGLRYEGATAQPGAGLYLELAGGALAVLAGLAGLLATRGRKESPRGRPDAGVETSPADEAGD